MIQVKVEEFCHDCPVFSPETEKLEWYANNIPYKTNTIIKCKRERECSMIKEYLEKLNKENKND